MTHDSGIPSLVALGGGHGLSATLRAARLVADHVTAVVTVADDGGSSGRLRRELGILPPGDLRMALCALAAEDVEVLAARDRHLVRAVAAPEGRLAHVRRRQRIRTAATHLSDGCFNA